MWCKFDRTGSDVVAEFTTVQLAQKKRFLYTSNRLGATDNCASLRVAERQAVMQYREAWILRHFGIWEMPNSSADLAGYQRHWASKWPKLHTLLPSESLVVQRLCPANPPMKCLKTEALALLSVVFRPAPWLKVESEGSVEWYPI